jgi:hypothetical protein
MALAGRERIVSIDTEFVPPVLGPRGLVSLAVTDGHDELYLINADTDFQTVLDWKHPWMIDNVVRHLPLTADGWLDRKHPQVVPYEEIQRACADFFGRDKDRRPKVVANCGTQDVVRLHGLWDHDWSEMPRGVPHSFTDVNELQADLGISDEELPYRDPSGCHHALMDARHELAVYRFLTQEAQHRGWSAW